ncbi:leucine-rich repeat-containing protein 61 [Microcaecilia unicolor]|uniref:Leucine-rich repeat-containing protein 61 n=1 Tax=Microcaecilia unicolor TaxID=1415580 RepID=A0A6P7X599_9AMPH|nr:leucine-rich repeat-containing protein 61 [Microcaecilia unicolor]XP_030045745.1 leucine-rich repeat-containing protein 61 [Microcaecilia unicolor]
MENRMGRERESENRKITSQLLKSKTGEFDLESILFLKLKGLSIYELGCIGECLNLERLDLSNNNITHLGPLASLKLLVVLNLSANRITTLEPLGSCDSLQSLNAAGNNINCLENLQSLTGLGKLESIRLRDPVCNLSNPLCNSSTYQSSLLDMIPSIKVIDGERVSGQGSDLYKLCKDIDNSLKRFLSNGPVTMEIPGTKSGAAKPWVEESYWDVKPAESSIIDEAYKQFNDVLQECKELSKRADDTIAQAEQALNIRNDPTSFVF